MIVVTSEKTEGTELKAEVDEDIGRFNTYFQGLGNDPLVRSETAVLSTYLWFKIKGGSHEK